MQAGQQLVSAKKVLLNGRMFRSLAYLKLDSPLETLIKMWLLNNGVHAFLDWRLFYAFNEKIEILDINQACHSMVMAGFLTMDAEWFNPVADGYTYKVV